MKLKEFNPENSVTVRAPKAIPAALRISKVGLFILNRPAVDLIGLTEKDTVKVHQDEEVPENWYIEKIAKGGFPVRFNEKGTECKFNSKFVAHKIGESLDKKEAVGRMLIAGKPTKIEKRTLWGILTVGLKTY